MGWGWERVRTDYDRRRHRGLRSGFGGRLLLWGVGGGFWACWLCLSRRICRRIRRFCRGVRGGGRGSGGVLCWVPCFFFDASLEAFGEGRCWLLGVGGEIWMFCFFGGADADDGRTFEIQSVLGAETAVSGEEKLWDCGMCIHSIHALTTEFRISREV